MRRFWIVRYRFHPALRVGYDTMKRIQLIKNHIFRETTNL
jgi:hypothetical protein